MSEPIKRYKKDCAYPNCDCGQRERASEKHSDIELASAWDDPTVLMLPILPKYEP
jgi:hypothetical protein